MMLAGGRDPKPPNRRSSQPTSTSTRRAVGAAIATRGPRAAVAREGSRPAPVKCDAGTVDRGCQGLVVAS